jgi:RNA polymerase sigma-70 factor (ECF subfamily)
VNWKRLLSEQVSENGKLLFGLAYGLLRNVDAAEDVCQQALLQAWQNRKQLKDSAKMRAWLAKMVVNESLRVVRRRKLELRSVQQGLTESRQEQAPDIGMELNEAVAVALEKISEPERLIVMLRVMRGMSGKDVARMFGMSEASVSRHMAHAMERLRELLVTSALPKGG